jgi:hypothetical protein
MNFCACGSKMWSVFHSLNKKISQISCYFLPRSPSDKQSYLKAIMPALGPSIIFQGWEHGEVGLRTHINIANADTTHDCSLEVLHPVGGSLRVRNRCEEEVRLSVVLVSMLALKFRLRFWIVWRNEAAGRLAISGLALP